MSDEMSEQEMMETLAEHGRQFAEEVINATLDAVGIHEPSERDRIRAEVMPVVVALP